MLHLVEDDLGDDGYAWFDSGELINGAYGRLAAEDAMDAHEQADYLLDDER